MIDQATMYKEVIQILDKNNATYKLFEHRAAYSYEDLQAVQKEAGFIGTEGKCMVIKTDEKFVVYVTIFSKKLDFNNIKKTTSSKKARLATKEELKEYFGAEPGCAYPFGFDAKTDIYVDPLVYEQEWFLFSPVFPTKTVQVKGENLKNIFQHLQNNVAEVSNFNIA